MLHPKKYCLLLLLASGAALALSQSNAIDPVLISRANAGDCNAQVEIGETYAQGKLGKPDPRTAAQWYQKGADKSCIAAEMHLGALYRDGGKGFPRDLPKAAAWYAKAAEQGDIEAEGTLGLLYFYGQGVRQDFVEAYFWLDLAATANGPKHEQYAANRQLVGQRITYDELDTIHDREEKWLAAHPRPAK